MTREEAKPYIGELKMYAKSRGWDEEYLIACDIAINELEQETVSKESYDHEYVLRKEFEIKIDKLRRQLKEQAMKAELILDKIRSEIVDLGQRTMNDNRASGIWACRDIIDRYKAESETQESVDKENNE